VTPNLGVVLDAARVQAGMEAAEVWFAYFSLGGMLPPQIIDSILKGRVVPSDEDYDLLAQALNERFMDRGSDHPVPYRDEI
jgi:hypothetical protein